MGFFFSGGYFWLFKLEVGSGKMQKGELELGELEWWSEMNLFGEQMAQEAAEVPQMSMSMMVLFGIDF